MKNSDILKVVVGAVVGAGAAYGIYKITKAMQAQQDNSKQNKIDELTADLKKCEEELHELNVEEKIIDKKLKESAEELQENCPTPESCQTYPNYNKASINYLMYQALKEENRKNRKMKQIEIMAKKILLYENGVNVISPSPSSINIDDITDDTG